MIPCVSRVETSTAPGYLGIPVNGISEHWEKGTPVCFRQSLGVTLVCNARWTMARDRQRGDRRVVQVPEFNLLSRYSSISLWCPHLTGATFL